MNMRVLWSYALVGLRNPEIRCLQGSRNAISSEQGTATSWFATFYPSGDSYLPPPVLRFNCS
jgi:hypothetical protein